MVRKASALAGIHLRPYDLRHLAAMYAYRSGVPVEIVSFHFQKLKSLRLDRLPGGLVQLRDRIGFLRLNPKPGWRR
jgi:hypothetical protein